MLCANTSAAADDSSDKAGANVVVLVVELVLVDRVACGDTRPVPRRIRSEKVSPVPAVSRSSWTSSEARPQPSLDSALSPRSISELSRARLGLTTDCSRTATSASVVVVVVVVDVLGGGGAG